MNLVIDGNLAYPPSEISCVRDVTLYCAVWGEFSVLLEIDREFRDHLWKHLKRFGAYDYVQDIVSVDREPGFKIGEHPRSNLQVDRIAASNLNRIITTLQRFG